MPISTNDPNDPSNIEMYRKQQERLMHADGQSQQAQVQRGQSQAATGQGSGAVDGINKTKGAGSAQSSGSVDRMSRTDAAQTTATGGSADASTKPPLSGSSGAAASGKAVSRTVNLIADMPEGQAASFLLGYAPKHAAALDKAVGDGMALKNLLEQGGLHAQVAGQHHLEKQLKEEHHSAILTACISLGFSVAGAAAGFKYAGSKKIPGPVFVALGVALPGAGTPVANAIDKNVGFGKAADDEKLQVSNEKIRETRYQQEAQSVGSVLDSTREQAKDQRHQIAQMNQTRASDVARLYS